MSARKIAASYLIFQAFGTAAWWGLLLSVPRSVKWFQPSAWPTDALLGFWLADSVLLIGGSVGTAVAILACKPWATNAVWALAVAVWYPALYCIGVSITTDEAWVASALMVSVAGLTLAMATIHGNASQSPATFRATAMSKTAAICWTFSQILIFWSVFLWILPKGIVELGQKFGLPAFAHAHQHLAATCLFLAASVLGLTSAITMATCGNGTPLPTATTHRLVVAGPYRFLRNPMALAGFVQGVAAGWFFGSYAVIVYSLTGVFVWHVFVRPVEERDLQRRFGDSYSQYQQTVWLWVPRLNSMVTALQSIGQTDDGRV